MEKKNKFCRYDLMMRIPYKLVGVAQVFQIEDAKNRREKINRFKNLDRVISELRKIKQGVFY
jgi:hypothetical protein